MFLTWESIKDHTFAFRISISIMTVHDTTHSIAHYKNEWPVLKLIYYAIFLTKALRFVFKKKICIINCAYYSYYLFPYNCIINELGEVSTRDSQCW